MAANREAHGGVLHSQRADREAWWMAVVLLLFYILSLIDRSVIVLLIEPIKADLRLSDFQVSLIVGPAFGVAFTIACLPAGWAADRFQRRLLIFGGVLLWAVMTVLSGFATTFVAFFAVRSLVALGEAILAPSAYSLIADRFPPDRQGRAVALFNMGPRLGQAAAYFLGAAALAISSAMIHEIPWLSGLRPWQLVLVIVGAPGGLFALLAFTFSEPPRTRTVSVEGEDRAGAVTYLWATRRVFAPLLAAFCLVTLVGGAITSWTPSYMIRAFGWTPAQAGSALGVVSTIAALSLLPAGAALDWLYRRGFRDAALRVFGWMLVPSIPIGIGIYFVKEPLLFLIGHGLFTFVVAPCMIYIVATLNLIVPSDLRGRVTAFMILVVSLTATILGSTTVAALTDFVFQDEGKLGWSLSIVAGAGSTLALALIVHVIPEVRSRVPAKPRLAAEEKAYHAT